MTEKGFYLAGRWIESGVLRASGNPYKDNEPIARVHQATPRQILAAYDSACIASQIWGEIDPEERAQFLQGAFNVVYENRYEIARLISDEQGKTLSEAMILEVLPSLDFLNYYAAKAPLFLTPDKVTYHQPFFHSKESRVIFSPVGVVAILTPSFNPWVIPLVTTLLAITAGNAVILKPSLKTALCGLKIAEVFDSIGLPAGVLSVITGGDDVGEALCKMPVQAVTFIGEKLGGKLVAAECATSFKKHVLECDGKNSLIVLDDADIEAAAKGALWGAFANNGQSHGATDRVLVQSSIAGQFKDALLENFNALNSGDPLAHDTDLGPMIDTEAHAFLNRIISDAVAGGAKILARKDVSHLNRMNFYPPILLEGVDSTMYITREPFNGPVMTIQEFHDDADALHLANDTVYGLSASLWSADPVRISLLAKRMSFGNIWANDVMFPCECPQAPWGGTKQSGHGQISSPYGILEYVHLKHVGFDDHHGASKQYYFPYTSELRSYIEDMSGVVKNRNPVSKFFSRLMFWESAKMRRTTE